MNRGTLQKILDYNCGILRCAPTFLSRLRGESGRHLRLHPNDYDIAGNSSMINERWFTSTVSAVNDHGTVSEDGMCHINTDDTQEGKILFKEFVDQIQEELIGKKVFEKYGTWPVYAKFADFEDFMFYQGNFVPDSGCCVGEAVAYYYPMQYNNYIAKSPYAYFECNLHAEKRNAEKYFCVPVTVRGSEDYVEKKIIYGNPYLYATELTVFPGREIVITDETAYGCVVIQGYGRFGMHSCASPSMLRLGRFSEDEFFVSDLVAHSGIIIKNLSLYEPLVMLKHMPCL